ncbi:hypothetical protein C7H09_04940 [Marinobacter fuscus]|uniref:Uncharacterized protein n=1 Tax=Marinobacter fuscus TaxID=2109942 RepID=A0A2T1KP57_9GAMM|nr:acyl-CoA dehydrogenase family protein [Marinobacter fuscus]PSF11907.1 hypothetical protein C7H09_04940 [Marinobacter fuscus]
MNETDLLILDAAERLLSDICTTEAAVRYEQGQVPEDLANAILDSGLPLAWVPEEFGGVGGSLALGFELIRKAASFALPLPLAETLVANLLLAVSGLTVPGRWTALGYDGGELPVAVRGEVNGTIEMASGAHEASVIVVPVLEKGHLRVASFAPSTIDMEHRRNLAGEVRTRIILRSAIPSQLSGRIENLTEDGLRQFCALLRAVQIVGALDRVGELTLDYVAERKQFGRALGKFQAVQNRVADIVGETALAGAAVQQAVRTVSNAERPLRGDRSTAIAIASAKFVAGEAAQKVPENAHQAHGAMGFSYEYPLQHFTRRVWSWREEFGSEFYWSEYIGELIQDEVQSGHGDSVLGKAWDLATR